MREVQGSSATGMKAFGKAAAGAILLCSAQGVFAEIKLELTLNAAYNLVVDSNVCSPPTYAPEVGTHSVEICNRGTVPLTDVVAYVGDFANGTPAVYPARDSALNSALCAQSQLLCDTGSYALEHLGAAVDGTRYIGDLGVGQCSDQYWSFTYPETANKAVPSDPCIPVWGESNDPNDDLTLNYDIWVTSAEGAQANTSRTVTMRNEISASANKIYPNNGLWFNEPSVCEPGTVVTTQGINYELGVVNQGFDNDGDGDADYNGWLQPIGDANWNPGCFRLVNSFGQLQIRRGGALEYLDFENQLYFTDLGPNSGVTGVVTYQFACLDGACQVPLTPYQEAASGQDNEKFAGDYGTSTVTIESREPSTTLDKRIAGESVSSDNRAEPGEVITYRMDVGNPGDTAVGNVEFGIPLVVRDEIPVGMAYAGNAVAGPSPNPLPAGMTVAILYSVDGGISWSASEPATLALVTDLQWRFGRALAPGETVVVGFDAVVDNPYSGDPVIVNTAGLSFGDAAPFLEDSVGIPFLGPNRIGDTVFQDDGNGGGVANNGAQEGGETAIAGIGIELWWDADGDGELSDGDLLIDSVDSGADGTGCNGTGNYCFEDLGDGDYLVIIDDRDADLAPGFRLTTPFPGAPETVVAVSGLGVGVVGLAEDVSVDFGFGPSLTIDKTLTSGTPVLEGDQVTYEIAITNNRPAADVCEFLVWGENFDPANTTTAADNPSGATGSQGPDDVFAALGEGGGGDDLRIVDFTPGPYPGAITSVEVLFRIFLENPVSNDDLDFFVNDGTADSILYTVTPGDLNALALNRWALISQDVTNDPIGGWTLAEFTNAFIDFDYKHNGAPDDASLRFDAAGFRIRTDAPCGAPSDNMSTVPLTDLFDPLLLNLVSATDCGTASRNAPPSCIDGNEVIDQPDNFVAGNPPSLTTAGTASWANVGPLDAGQTTVYELTFTASLPAGVDALTAVANTASVTNAFFADGFPVNDASDVASNDILPTGSISGFVFNNNNAANGTFDTPNEDGLPNVTLFLDLNNNGVADVGEPTAVTDSTGFYQFTLLEGDGDDMASEIYTVVVDESTLPGGAALTTPTVNPDQPFTGGAVGNSAATDSLAGDPAQIISVGDGNDANNDVADFNFGYTIPNYVYGTVVEDANRNGVLDITDNALAGVTVEIFLATDLVNPVGSTTTDANGFYEFVDVTSNPSVEYVVVVDRTLIATPDWDNSFDPDGTLDDQTSQLVNGGNIYGSFDFGYFETGSASIAGTVYTDWNRDADIDAGEDLLDNVTVLLYEDDNGNGIVDPEDALVRAETTANGAYSFAGLPDGDWIVVVDQGTLGYVGTQTEDPDVTGICGGNTCTSTGSVTTTGAAETDVDFGYVPGGNAAIGDYVWIDLDGDGIQDASEVGLPNVSVTIYEDNDGTGTFDPAVDALIAVTATDGNGGYTFYNLPADGDYLIQVDLNDPQIPLDVFGQSYVLTSGTAEFFVSEADLAGAGGSFLDADFGFGPGGRIGDRVYQDNNGNGDYDASTDPGINGVTVELYIDSDPDPLVCGTANGTVATTVTANEPFQGDGYYLFTGLAPDTYCVVVGAGIPAGFDQTGDPDNTLDGATTVVLNANSGATYADFGYQPPGTIAGSLWIDQADDPTDTTITNVDGVFDLNETPLAGVPVQLRNNGVIVQTTTTDASGTYSFGNLGDSANYSITYDATELPANLNQTYEADTSVNNTQPTPVSSGNDVTDVDFAFQRDGQLVVDKDTLTPRAARGGVVTYRIVVRNTGGSAVNGVSVDDTLPAAAACGGPCFTYVTGTITESDDTLVQQSVPFNEPVVGASSLTWNGWTIQAGASITIQFDVAVNAATPLQTYDNTVSVSGSNGGGAFTIDDDGLLGQDADTPVGQDPETDEDVTITGLPLLEITKTSDSADNGDCFAGAGDGEVSALEQIRYCITVTNTGDAPANNIRLSDAAPAGTTFVSGNILTMPTSNLQEATDNFEGGFPAGGSGWAGSWGGSGASTVADLGDTSLRVVAKNKDATRSITVPGGQDTAVITFDYRRFAFDSQDVFNVSLCGNVVATITGTGADTNDFAYRSIEIDVDIGDLVPGTCVFRLFNTANTTGEFVYVDNVRIEFGARVDAGLFTQVATNNAPGLVVAADGYDLWPGESATFEMTVDVANASGLTGITQVSNTAFVSSDTLPPVSDAAVDTLLNSSGGTIGNLVWLDVTEDGVYTPTMGTDSDQPIENVRVELYACLPGGCDGVNDTFLLATTTAADGTYLFANLGEGNYRVRIDPRSLPISLTPLGIGDSNVSPYDTTLTLASPNDLNADFAYELNIVPLPVTLASINAVERDGQLVIEWTTATEVGNAGFFLFGEIDDGEWVELTPEMVPSSAVNSTAVQYYSITLPKQQLAAVAVADMDVRGRMTVHGPFDRAQMAESKPPEQFEIPWGAIQKEQKALLAKRIAKSGGVPEAVRFEVTDTGIHEVTYDDILAAGLDLDGVRHQTLSLHDANGPVPLRVIGSGRFGPGSAIQFLGRPAESLYAKTSLYTLRTDRPEDALRIAKDNNRPGRGSAIRTYVATVENAPDNVYNTASPNGDPWHDQRIFARTSPVSATRTLVVPEPALDGGPATLVVDVWGLTNWPETPDHHVRVRVDGVEVFDGLFDGTEIPEITASLETDAILDGLVDVEIEVVGDLGPAYDIIALEGVSVHYERDLIVPEGRVSFRSDSALDFELASLPDGDPVVFREGPAGVEELRMTVSGRNGAYTLRIPGAGEAVDYHVADRSGLLRPTVSPVYPLEPMDDGAADYLVVTHPSFEAGIQPLVELREDKGLKVRVVTTEQIYEAYSGGNPDAESIKAYIRDAASSSSIRYVILVGGDTYDYFDYLGYGSISFVPSLYRPSGDLIRFAPADAIYGLPDSRGVPQIPVGRLPVRTEAELANVVGKILAYENKDYGRSIVAAADFGDAVYNIDYGRESDALLQPLGDRWNITRAYMEEIGKADARTVLLDALNSGVALTQFFGHSAPTLWSFSRLFSSSDALNLTNIGRPSTVVQWGCWNTYYVEPRYNTLGQTLMLNDSGGAAAVIGATTLTETLSDVELGRQLMPLLTEPGRDIGRALVGAKARMLSEFPELYDVIVGWSILGDPAMVIDDGR